MEQRSFFFVRKATNYLVVHTHWIFTSTKTTLSLNRWPTKSRLAFIHFEQLETFSFFLFGAMHIKYWCSWSTFYYAGRLSSLLLCLYVFYMSYSVLGLMTDLLDSMFFKPSLGWIYWYSVQKLSVFTPKLRYELVLL